MLRFTFFAPEISKFFHGLVGDIIDKRTKSGNTRKDFMQLLIQLKEKGTVAPDDDNHSADTTAPTSDYSQFIVILIMNQFDWSEFIIINALII